MTPEQYVQWLSGFVSALGGKNPTANQFAVIRETLQKNVFNKVTPDRQNNQPIYNNIEPKLDCTLLTSDLLTLSGQKPSTIC